jgi:hypothetical protein
MATFLNSSAPDSLPVDKTFDSVTALTYRAYGFSELFKQMKQNVFSH